MNQNLADMLARIAAQVRLARLAAANESDRERLLRIAQTDSVGEARIDGEARR